MPTLNSIRALGSFQKSYRFRALFSKLPAVVSGIDVNALNLIVESTELPRQVTESIEINLHQHRLKEPGRVTSSGVITMTLRETENPLARDLVNQWNVGVGDLQSGVQGSKADVEAILVIQQLDSNDNPTMTYRLEGVYLEEADLGSLEGGTSDTQVISLTLSYDNFTASVGG